MKDILIIKNVKCKRLKIVISILYWFFRFLRTEKNELPTLNCEIGFYKEKKEYLLIDNFKQ